jgi:hypothetical protein
LDRKTIFHRTPGIAKHLGPFGRTINHHADGEVDATARSSAPPVGRAPAAPAAPAAGRATE